MKIYILFFLCSYMYINNAVMTDEKLKLILDHYWEIHYQHANRSYNVYKGILEKFKNKEYDEDDILREFKYFPTKDHVTVETIKSYIDDLYNFTYHDPRCYLCFEQSKRWYWENYEKNYKK